MDARSESRVATLKHETKMERKSDREIVITRTVNGPARLVFEVWTKAELFQRWWVPKSAPLKLLSCEMDVRVGGSYRLVFRVDADNTMAFFGEYLEVTPCSRLVWTNDEQGIDHRSITTVTFEERGDQTLVIVSELHPTKEALESSGAADGLPESLQQLEDLIAMLTEGGANAGMTS